MVLCMVRFEYLEDEAIADIAFKAYGGTINELFLNAAMATANLQTDIELLDDNEVRYLQFEKSDLDRLLKEFLSEILFYKDAELLFAKDFEIDVSEIDEGYKFEGKLIGGIFDPSKHPMHNDLKAITWHDFKVSRLEDSWQCYVLIDI